MSATLAIRRPRLRTIADLMESLGDIAISRVCLDPAPGKATEADLLRLREAHDRPYELVDGTLVEKAMGMKESFLAAWIIGKLAGYLADNDIGAVSGPDGTMRLRPRLVRIPDVAFLLWENIPPADEPMPQIPDLAPDLAVEVLSPSNTPKEMDRKRKEYFDAGTRLVWQVNPIRKEVEVFTSPGRSRTLVIGDTLDGGTLLPGFRLPLATIFAVRGGTKRGSARKKKKK